MNWSAANGQDDPRGAGSDEGLSEFTRNLDILRQVPFFASLPLEPLKLLAYLSQREVFRPGDELYRQGDHDGRALYFIDGRAELWREGIDAPLTDFGPGTFLGGLSLLGEARRLFTLRAVSRVECLVLARERFVKTLERFPDLLPRVLDAVVSGVRDWEEGFVVNHAAVCVACRAGLGVSLL